ncbi:MAG: hypothetical protein DWQ19_08930 [Crenarchaeota archaeon]|nr:MAG: hypothetical protein DWQ19_08930 [Thermoproteota archaeon]
MSYVFICYLCAFIYDIHYMWVKWGKIDKIKVSQEKVNEKLIESIFVQRRNLKIKVYGVYLYRRAAAEISVFARS